MLMYYSDNWLCLCYELKIFMLQSLYPDMRHETAIKVITFQRDISGFHLLRWSEAIHQLVWIRFNLTPSLSLSPGLYIFLHLHRLEGRHYFTPGRRTLWWKWTVRHIRRHIAHPAEDQFKHGARLEPWFHLQHAASFYFPLIIQINISFQLSDFYNHT